MALPTLFTNLIDQARANEEAQQAQAAAALGLRLQKKQEAQEAAFSRMSSLLGDEFMSAILPYITEKQIWPSLAGLTAYVELPGCQRIQLDYHEGKQTVQAATVGEGDCVLYRGDGQLETLRFGALLQNIRKRRQRQEAYEAELAAYEAKQNAYNNALEQWRQQRDRINAANAAALATLQKEFDAEFPLWELTYALVAYDEECGYDTVQSETVKVLSPQPDSDGWWTVVEPYGHVEKTRFWHVVSLTDARTYRASKRNYAQTVRVADYGAVGYLPPNTPPAWIAEYQARAVALIQPRPEQPDPADFGTEDDQTVPF